MNREQINALRARLGLAPVVSDAATIAKEKARKRQQAANRAAHAQLQRDLKHGRSKGLKK
jgi:hypothetical protein